MKEYVCSSTCAKYTTSGFKMPQGFCLLGTRLGNRLLHPEMEVEILGALYKNPMEN